MPDLRRYGRARCQSRPVPYKLVRNRYIPGHIHAFYLEYCYYERKEGRALGRARRAPGVYSSRINTARGAGYGTIAHPV